MPCLDAYAVPVSWRDVNVLCLGHGRAPSIAPGELMRALLLQVLYSMRSERQLVELINYNLLFRWFVGLSIEDAVWNHSVLSKTCDPLIEHSCGIRRYSRLRCRTHRPHVR
jgi:transposase